MLLLLLTFAVRQIVIILPTAVIRHLLLLLRGGLLLLLLLLWRFGIAIIMTAAVEIPIQTGSLPAIKPIGVVIVVNPICLLGSAMLSVGDGMSV